MRKFTHYFVILALLAVYFLCYIPFNNYTTDDTYISLQFAKNLVQLGELSFNPGAPVYATTTPLWVTSIALIYRLFHFDLPLIAKSLGVLFGFLSVIALFFLTLKISKSRLISFMAATLLIFDVMFLRWISSGMETAVSVFFVIIILYIYLVEKEKNSSGTISSFLCGLATLVRPEFLIFFIALSLDRLVNNPIKRLSRLFASIIMFFIPLIPWNLYVYSVFGSIIPNSITAKIRYSYFFPLKQYLAGTLGAYPIESVALITSGVILGINNKSGFVKMLKENIRYVLWPVGLGLFYILGKADLLSRYMLMFFPLIIIFGLISIKYILERYTHKPLFSMLFIYLLIMFYNLAVFFNLVYPHVYHTGNYNIENIYVYYGQWLKANTPKDAVIAMGEVGIIGYYADRKILDTAALISPEIVPYVRAEQGWDSLIAVKIKKADYYVGGEEIRKVYGNKAKLILARNYYAGRVRDQKDKVQTRGIYKLTN